MNYYRMSPKLPLESKLSQLRREGEERAAQRRASKQGIPYLNLTKFPISREALKLISEAEARQAKILPIQIKHKKIIVAAVDFEAAETKKIAKKFETQEFEIKKVIISPSNLRYGLDFYKSISPPRSKITSEVEIKTEKLEKFQKTTDSIKSTQEKIKDFHKSNDTTEFFELILASALSLRASDIHFEPEENLVKLRFRIDGLLYDIAAISGGVYHNALSRIKLLSALKLNVINEAQDGRFTIKNQSNEIEVRSSVIPSEYGETVVMRILDPRTASLELEKLGLREEDIKTVEKELKRPNGTILSTGPTGSGKTTTLYAFLKKIKKPEVKIITIEDPIEYHLEGIEQTQIDESGGYNFSNGLKSILRQDPDVILVGEIRDGETAEIAIHASLTGHLVLSTLHTNDAVGALPRLVDLGVRKTVLSSSLNLVVAQRLVRRLCDKCKTPIEIDANLTKQVKNFLNNLPSKISFKEAKKPTIYKSAGCKECNETGYWGRIGIFELLVITKKIESILNQEISETNIKEATLKDGMITLQKDGLIKVLRGITSLEEVERETGIINW